MLHAPPRAVLRSTDEDNTIGPCSQCRCLMTEIVSLNKMVDALSSRLDVSVSDFMLESHRRSSALQQRDVNRDTHEADLRLESVKYQREASRLSLRVMELEKEVALRSAREEKLCSDVAELQERLMLEREASVLEQQAPTTVSSWTQTDMRFHTLVRNEAAYLSKRHSVSPAASHHLHEGLSSQGASPSLRAISSSASAGRSVSATTTSTAVGVVVLDALPHWEDQQGTSPRGRSASPAPPIPTPKQRTVLSAFHKPTPTPLPCLLDGVSWEGVTWPSELSDDEEAVVGGDEDRAHTCANMSTTRPRVSCERSVSLPSTSSVMSASFKQYNFGATPIVDKGRSAGVTRCMTPPSTRRPQGRRATVFNGQWSSSVVVPHADERQHHARSPTPESPLLHMMPSSRNARTPSFPRVLDRMQITGGPHTIRSNRRQPVPRETAGLYQTAVDGLHMLRGLTVRADPNMLRTMTTMHELRDICCPLKQALATVKQILLGAMPRLSTRIRDGELWQVRKRDLQALHLEHCGSLATALRSLMVAHDYLKGQERGQALGSLVEMYLNMHVFVALARAPAVQGHFSS